MNQYPPGTAAAAGLACCHVCCKLSAPTLHACPLCGAALHVRNTNSLQTTIALVITAIMLYIPANILPIMTTTQLGRPEDSTILGGVVLLIHHGSYPIAAVIFIASVMVPTGKLIAICWLCWSVARRQATSHQQRTRLYRITEFVGKWSMTDVFVVAILLAFLAAETEQLTDAAVGPGLYFFAGYGILSLLAGHLMVRHEAALVAQPAGGD